ncbi:MAG: 3-oxoacyl-ACP reductase FabG [Myxococcales bacterium]|nr:3-oxoacyl-ACP reductase FabG [Myxococcales bacterium]
MNETTTVKTRAFVTGGSRGIGAAIALRLAEAGHPIVLNFRSNQAAAEKIHAAIQAMGVEVQLCPFDVADAQQSAAAIEALLQDGKGHIGIVVNNAGIARDNSFPVMKQDEWESVTRTTLDGFYNVTRPLLMPMVRQRFGRIINIASFSGVAGNRGQVNYSAAKAGLIGATKALALEVARRNITVNAVAPGLIETEMIQSAPIEKILEHIPMRRLGKPEEVAALVAFLASEGAGYITGQVLGINGGLG